MAAISLSPPTWMRLARHYPRSCSPAPFDNFTTRRLRLLIGTRSGSLRAKRLFDDTTDRSRVGGVRNPQSVRSGRHAADLAIALVAALLDKRPTPRTHLFLAAPNAFGFMLGQRRARLGPVTLYEYDFEGNREESYRPSLSLPIELRGD